MGQKVVLVVEQKDGLLVSLVKMSLKIGYYVMLWPFIVIVRLLENRTQGTLGAAASASATNTNNVVVNVIAPPAAAAPAQVIKIRCGHCGGLVDQGVPRCPACNAAC